MLLCLSDKVTHLIRDFVSIKSCILLRRNAFMIEKQFSGIGNSDDLQVDISTLEDIGTCFKNLLNKSTSYSTTPEDRQIDTFGDFKYFPMNYIDRLRKVLFVYHHTYVASRSRVVNEQWYHLVANECIVRFVKVGQVLSYDRNHAYLLHKIDPAYVLTIYI